MRAPKTLTQVAVAAGVFLAGSVERNAVARAYEHRADDKRLPAQRPQKNDARSWLFWAALSGAAAGIARAATRRELRRPASE